LVNWYLEPLVTKLFCPISPGVELYAPLFSPAFRVETEDQREALKRIARLSKFADFLFLHLLILTVVTLPLPLGGKVTFAAFLLIAKCFEFGHNRMRVSEITNQMPASPQRPTLTQQWKFAAGQIDHRLFLGTMIILTFALIGTFLEWTLGGNQFVQWEGVIGALLIEYIYVNLMLFR